MSDELPEGWATVQLGDVAEVKLGKMLDKAKHTAGTHLPYLRNASVRWSSFDLSDLLTMPFIDDELDCFGLQNGDLLVCEGGEPGRCAIWDGGSTNIKFQKALLRVRPRPVVEARWILHALRAASVTGELEQYFTGTTIKHFPREAVLRFAFSLPPLAEQRRIVAKVEALLARVTAAREQLESVPLLLKRFRQSVLAAVWSGLPSAEPPPLIALKDLLAEPLSNGRSVPDGTGFPVLRMSALRNGRIDLLEQKKGAWSLADGSRFSIRSGDFLVARGNGSLSLLGRGGLVEDVPEPVAFPDTLIRIRPNLSLLNPRYLRLVWESPQVRAQLEAAAHTTAGIHKVSQQDLARINLPVPSMPEQRQLIDRATAVLGGANLLEDGLARGRSASWRLSQAILSKAFAGDLVPTEAELARQDGREFESGEDLLRRISGSTPEILRQGITERRRKVVAASA